MDEISRNLEEIKKELSQTNSFLSKTRWFLLVMVFTILIISVLDNVQRRHMWGIERGEGIVECYSGGKLIIRQEIEGTISRGLNMGPLFGYIVKDSEESILTNAHCFVQHKKKKFFSKK